MDCVAVGDTHLPRGRGLFAVSSAMLILKALQGDYVRLKCRPNPFKKISGRWTGYLHAYNDRNQLYNNQKTVKT